MLSFFVYLCTFFLLVLNYPNNLIYITTKHNSQKKATFTKIFIIRTKALKCLLYAQKAQIVKKKQLSLKYLLYGQKAQITNKSS